MSPPHPTVFQIAILRYVRAARGQFADPGNLALAHQCVAHGWLTGGEREGFDLTDEGAGLAAES